MNAYHFMASSPWLTFFLALLGTVVVQTLIKIPFRHLNIRKHGWPPSHLDADGDFKTEDAE